MNRPRIDAEDLEQCGRLALSMGVTVAEIRGCVEHYGEATDAVALGVEHRRFRRLPTLPRSKGPIPVIGILSDSILVQGAPMFAAPAAPVQAVLRAVGGIPFVICALSDSPADLLLEGLDGVLFPGGQTNVHPARYGRKAQSSDGPFDEQRDDVALRLIPRALQLGIPALFTCRGFQELNVAFGGTLRKEPPDVPDELGHGTPQADSEDGRYRLRQKLIVSKPGLLHDVCGCDEMVVNSLHSFLIDDLAPILSVEAYAEDGSVEAVSVKGAKGFALGTAFHPEYWATSDPPSNAVLRAFSKAAHAFAEQRRQQRGT